MNLYRLRDLEKTDDIANNRKIIKTKMGLLGLGILGATAYGVKKLRDSRSDKGKKRRKYNV